MAGKDSTGYGVDIYGYDPVDKDGSMAGDCSDEAMKNLGQLNRADVNSVNDSRAKADLNFPGKKGK